MAQVLLDLPDDLAEKVQTLAQSDRLGEVLSMGLNQPVVPAHIYSHILSFLISNPTPEAIADFRPIPEMQERLQILLERNSIGTLTPEEEAELREYEQVEHLIVMWKQLSTQYPQMLRVLKAEAQTTPINNQSHQKSSFLGYMKDSVIVKGDIIEPIDEVWEVCQQVATKGLLLDTHIWIWSMTGDLAKLPEAYMEAITFAETESELAVSAISVWEVGMLEAKGRINLGSDCKAWIDKALETDQNFV